MGVLRNQFRRCRRKTLSKPAHALYLALALSLVFILWHISSPSIPLEVVITPTFTTAANDPAIQWTKYAYVQYVASPDELCKAVMLLSEVKETYSPALRVLMYPSDWSLKTVNESDSGRPLTHIARLLHFAVDEFKIILQPTDILREKNRRHSVWADSYKNLLAFNLTQYDRVIVLDTNSILLSSLDELFFVEPTPVAMPYVYWEKKLGWQLSSNLMVIQPSSLDFALLEQEVRNATSGELVLDIIDRFYNETIVKLPQRPYHLNTCEFQLEDHRPYLGTRKVMWNPTEVLLEAKFVHFFDPPLPKPWVGPSMNDKTRYAPRCRRGRGRRVDCWDRFIWFKLYSDFGNRKKNICGAGFEQLAE
jgi:hypothetical protein